MQLFEANNVEKLWTVMCRVILRLFAVGKWEVWAAGKGQRSKVFGHISELCPQTNLMVGVYLAAALKKKKQQL